ncbi:Inosine-5'-monophosphate dehydrogenase [Streptomyces antimycoticus]
MPRSAHIVSDVMTHTVVAVGREAPFKEIVRTLEQWRVSALPVLEGEGRVIGVVSEADLLPKEEFRDSDPARSAQLPDLPGIAKAGAVTADELMTAPAITVHASATLAEAARIMTHKRVKRLPVVDEEGRLEGIVSRADLLKVFLRPDSDIEEEVRARGGGPSLPGGWGNHPGERGRGRGHPDGTGQGGRSHPGGGPSHPGDRGRGRLRQPPHGRASSAQRR